MSQELKDKFEIIKTILTVLICFDVATTFMGLYFFPYKFEELNPIIRWIWNNISIKEFFPIYAFAYEYIAMLGIVGFIKELSKKVKIKGRAIDFSGFLYGFIIALFYVVMNNIAILFWI
jgi:hypothetical protein